MAGVFSSREAAEAGSQGREPLAIASVCTASPGGATDSHGPHLYRPFGAYRFCGISFQGLTPLAIGCHPCGVIRIRVRSFGAESANVAIRIEAAWLTTSRGNRR